MEPKDKLKNQLIKKFNIQGTEFYNLVPFVKSEIGFSVKRKFKKSKSISLIKVGLLPEGSKKNIQPIYVSATFGSLNERGDAIAIRGGQRSRNYPLDLITIEDYQYNSVENKIFKHNVEIRGIDLLEEFYKVHVASRKNLRGFWIRLRLDLLRLVSRLIYAVTKVLELILFAISGTRYAYDPFVAGFEESESFKTKQLELTVVEGRKIEFLGYSASAWAVIFYCLLHLVLYFIFSAINFRSDLLITILKNNFLTIAYVIVTLWFIEYALPQLFVRTIKMFSILHFNLKYKKITIKM